MYFLLRVYVWDDWIYIVCVSIAIAFGVNYFLKLELVKLFEYTGFILILIGALTIYMALSGVVLLFLSSLFKFLVAF